MSKKDEALKLALEALENSIDLVEQDYDNAVSLYGNYPPRAKRLIGMETMRDDHRKAIATLREALAEQPAQQTIHCKHRRENNGVCPHHNLQCGWPKCNEPEQPVQQQEPVAWLHTKIEGVAVPHRPADLDKHPDRWTALYPEPKPCPTCEALARTVMMDQTAHDKQRKPLTDEQIMEMYNEPRSDAEMIAFARAIEAAHGIKEKNNG